MVTFWPSKKPASPRPLRNACNTSPVSSGERALMNPITGLVDGCARTENGQPAVAPPSNLMNSRRLIATPDAQEAAWYRVKPARGKALPMSALGQKQTYAVQKANPLYSRKRTFDCDKCYAQLSRSRIDLPITQS